MSQRKYIEDFAGTCDGDETELLGRVVAEYSEKINKLREALCEIVQWADSYPTRVFREPTKEQCKLAHELLTAHGMTLDAFSASMGRHCLKGVREIAQAALKDREC
jgi:hypothetical protein